MVSKNLSVCLSVKLNFEHKKLPRLAPFPWGYEICHTNFTSNELLLYFSTRPQGLLFFLLANSILKIIVHLQLIWVTLRRQSKMEPEWGFEPGSAIFAIMPLK